MRTAKALLPLVLLASLSSLSVLAQGTIDVVAADPGGEGLNDTTPVTAVGGNAATTLGAQRLAALREAARIWAERLPVNAHIRIRARFEPLACSANWAIFGSAGAASQARDFTGAPRANTWYPAALANTLAGRDLDPANDEIVASFSSALDDGSCAFPAKWYYGFDAQGPWDRIDFVTIAAHELGHGLGFQTYVDPATGARLLGRDDAFMTHLFDATSAKTWDAMSDHERAASAVNAGGLTWKGTNVQAHSRALAQGTGADGAVKLYAPAAVVPGSSVSHFDESVSPAPLLAPYYVEPTHSLDLTDDVLHDIGWPLVSAAASAPESSWVVASSARASGANGAFYTTDLTIANRGAVDTTFRVEFLGHDADGRTAPSKTFSLGAGKSVTYLDVLGSVFALPSGWGALRVVSATSSLIVAAQTGTPAAGGGRFGQSVPAAAAGDLVTPAASRLIVAVSEDGASRTNLVVANANPTPTVVSLALVGADGRTLGSWSNTFKPYEMRQLSQVVRVLGVSTAVSNAQLVLSTPTAGGAYAAYASLIDTKTNDPKTLLTR